MKNFNLIKHKYWFLAPSLILVIASWSLIAIFGWHWGIDFIGGTAWQINFNEASVDKAELETFLKNDLKLENVGVIPQADGQTYIIRTAEIAEESHQQYLTSL